MSGLLLFRYLRPTDEEVRAIEKRDGCSVPRRRGYPMPGRAMRGRTRLVQEAQGVGGAVGRSLYRGLCRKAWVRQGKQA